MELSLISLKIHNVLFQLSGIIHHQYQLTYLMAVWFAVSLSRGLFVVDDLHKAQHTC